MRRSRLTLQVVLGLGLFAGGFGPALSLGASDAASDEAQPPWASTNAAATVVLYFKPGQEHSEAVLRQFATLQAEFKGLDVRWLALAPEPTSIDEALRSCLSAGATIEIAIDHGGAWFGQLRIVLEPTTIIFDQAGHSSTHPFTKVNYPATIRTRIQQLLHPGGPSETKGAGGEKVGAGSTNKDEIANRRLKLARKLFAAKLYQRARENVNVAIARNPASVAAHILLGQICLAEGHPNDAARAFAEALRLEPTNAAARQAVSELPAPGLEGDPAEANGTTGAKS